MKITIKIRFGRRQSFAESHNYISLFKVYPTHYFPPFSHSLGNLPYLILGYTYHSGCRPFDLENEHIKSVYGEISVIYRYSDTKLVYVRSTVFEPFEKFFRNLTSKSMKVFSTNFPLNYELRNSHL